jgi:hypothetical protein
MFIFNRPLRAVAAGLGVALLFVALDRVRQPPATPDSARVANTRRSLVPRPAHGVSSAPVRDLSLSCRLPPASFASWLPSVKSRIVLDQVAVRAPTTQPISGLRSC